MLLPAGMGGDTTQRDTTRHDTTQHSIDPCVRVHACGTYILFLLLDWMNRPETVYYLAFLYKVLIGR